MPSNAQRVHAEEAYRSLRALEAIEGNPHISQRELARNMGVALGVANACVRTLVRKGLIKIRGESNRSITYHVTKEGRLQKARLAMEWTGNTIDFYVQARGRIAALLQEFADRGITRIVLYGADEAAELVALLAPHAGVTVLAAIAAEGRRMSDELVGVTVVDRIEPLPQTPDVVLACISPSKPAAAELRSAYPGVPIALLNGQTLEETPE